MRIWVGGIILFTLVGCGARGTLTGEIDGQTVPPIVDAAFAIVEDEANDVNVAFSIFTTYSDACLHLSSQFNILNDLIDPRATPDDVENSAEDFADYIEDNKLVDHWTIQIAGTAEKEADFRDENTLDIDPDEDENTSLSVSFQERAPEFENGRLELNQDSFNADDGAFAWSLDEELRDVTVKGNAELRDEDNDQAGDIEFEGTAVFCAELSDAVVELTENLNANSCAFARDGVCDEPNDCAAGTDETDCG